MSGVYWVMEERVDTLNDTTAPSIKQYRAAIKKYKSSSESLYIVVTHKICWTLDDFFQRLSLFKGQARITLGGGGSLSVVCSIVPWSRVMITLRDLHDQ